MENSGTQPTLSFISKQFSTYIVIALMNSTTYPLEMIRTRMQTIPELIRQKRISSPYSSIFDCVSQIKKHEGIKAFWKGNFTNLLRMLPNESFNFFIKESFQIWAKKHKLASSNNTSLNFISGSIGAIFTLIFIYPLDFTRSRLSNQVDGKGSIKKILVNVYKAEGMMGIYRGSINFFISAAIFRAFYIGIFDTVKNIDKGNELYRVSGAYVASLVAIYIVYPFDTIRKRMMMTSGEGYKYQGFRDCARKIISKQRFWALFRGWQLSLGQGLGAAACLLLFDQMCTDIKKKNGIETILSQSY